MITDQQFMQWLRADGVRRELLFEVTAVSGGTAVTRHLSRFGYVSGGNDTPAHTAYDDLVLATPEYRALMSEALGGRTLPSFGEIVVANEGGARDAWLNDAWDGRPVKVLIGDPGWPRSDFRLLLAGAIGDIRADRNRIVLSIRDKQHLLNLQAQNNLIAAGPNQGKPKPLAFGQVWNVEPVLIDAPTHRYQVHDGPIEALTQVYDNGLPVAAFAADLANGTFTLSQSAAGRITCDCKGAKPGGTYLTRIGDLVQHLVTTRSGLTVADVDTAAIAAFNALCPAPVGLYVRDRANLLDLLDELVQSVGGYYSFTRDGRLYLGRLQAPAGVPVLEFGPDDMRLHGLALRRRILPAAALRLGYRRNWTVMSDGVAGGVGELRRAELAAPYQTVTASNSVSQHLLASRPDEIGTLLVQVADAQAEVDRRAQLQGAIRGIYELDGFVLPLTLKLGDVVKVTHPRYGFAGGQLAVVVGITENPIKQTAKLELWK